MNPNSSLPDVKRKKDKINRDLTNYKAPGEKTAGKGVLLLPILILVGLGLIAWFLVASWKYLYADNPHFSLVAIRFTPTANFTPEQIIEELKLLGIEERQTTLPRLNLKKIRGHFLSDALIEDVQLRRILPGTLEINIQEREPVAWLKCNPPLAISRRGYILPHSLKNTPTGMPSIVGINEPDKLKIGTTTDNQMLLLALHFLDIARLRPEAYLRKVSLIQLDYANRNLVLFMSGDEVFKPGAQVTLPQKDMKGALERLRGIVNDRAAQGKTISKIDVTIIRNIPVVP